MARGIPKAVIEMLAAVPLLSACNKKELRQIAKLGTEIEVRDGEVLTEQGRPGREFFLVIDGKASCTVDATTVASFGPGDYFGEMALLERGPRHATVIAEGPMDVLVLETREFWGLVDAAPSIAKKLLVAFAQRERANATIRS
jgi:CRP/FNR family transcriptional regulator, cyclic AMP receptor protein